MSPQRTHGRCQPGPARCRAALAPTPHPLRGNGRAYVGRALGQGAPSWLVQGLRVLVFLAAGLIFGLLALALVP